MKTRGLPYQALMAAMAVAMSNAMAVGVKLSREDAYHQLGGIRSRGKGRPTSFPPSNGSARVKRAAVKARNQARHRAACRGAH